MNETSSRSHCVLTVQLEGLNNDTLETRHGVLNLIDLAGSERLNKSGATHNAERLKETQVLVRVQGLGLRVYYLRFRV